MEENTFLRPDVNTQKQKRGPYRDADPGVGGGRPPRTISESINHAKGYFKGFNAESQRKGANAKRSLARRAKMTIPLRYPKNTASKLSGTYGADFSPKSVEKPQARPATKLPGIGTASTPQRRPKTTPAKSSRSVVQLDEVRPHTTSNLESIQKKPKRKKTSRKKKCNTPLRRKSHARESKILEQQLEKVCHGRYVSVRGSLKLGSNKIKIAMQDITSGVIYRTSFFLDEESTQTAQDDNEQGIRMVRVVVLACDLVPNRGKNGLLKKKAWTVEIDPEQLQAVLEVNHEMDEQEYQQQSSSTRRAATASRNRRARERDERNEGDQEGEFDYFDEKACPPHKPNRRRAKKLENQKHQRHLLRKADFSMDAPPFHAKIDDIVFQCVRELDFRPMHILAAYRPLDGSITLQARDKSIDHNWRLVVRTRPADADPGADDGLNNRDIKEQLQALEGLVAMLDITNTSDYSLGKLELNMTEVQDEEE